MSLSRGCLLVERKPDEWFCIVAIAEYDYDFESYEVFGPARTEEGAWEKMTACNPGSYHAITHDKVTDAHRAMIAEGLKKGRNRYRSW